MGKLSLRETLFSLVRWFDYLQQIQGDQGARPLFMVMVKPISQKLWISDDIM